MFKFAMVCVCVLRYFEPLVKTLLKVKVCVLCVVCVYERPSSQSVSITLYQEMKKNRLDPKNLVLSYARLSRTPHCSVRERFEY